jgi:GTPase SAR1 family protein
MLDINIAVIGASATGKSCFIRRALGLPENTPHTMCHRKWTLEGTPYVVRLFELQLEEIKISDRSQIEWPKTIHGMTIPRVDGAITIYDVTNQKSLANIPEILSQYTVSTHIRGSSGANAC